MKVTPESPITDDATLWLNFRKVGGEEWGGVPFMARQTNEARLEQLREIGIETVEWVQRGKVVAVQSLEAAIKGWKDHIILDAEVLDRMPARLREMYPTFLLPSEALVR